MLRAHHGPIRTLCLAQGPNYHYFFYLGLSNNIPVAQAPVQIRQEPRPRGIYLPVA